VLVDPELSTKFSQVDPPSEDTSTLYADMEAPPLFVGAVHERVIVVRPEAEAVSEVGACGRVAFNASVVALTVGEADPVPTELMALTR